MCGRYAMPMRPAELRQQMRRTNMRVDRMILRGPNNQQPRQSYNVAPTYIEQVYRAVDASSQASDRFQTGIDGYELGGEVDSEGVEDGREYVLQSMKWGLVPSWNKQPQYFSSLLRTINCRADSIAQSGSMWTSMSNTKRCIVPMEGFYEWLPKGKDRIPYYISHPTQPLLYLAGLYDSVIPEGQTEPIFTYTIITTDTNKQLSFLHDRMPVLLEPGSQEMLDWLDPTVKQWNSKLQNILKPYEGELRVEQVGMEVNKVGSDGRELTVPVSEKKGCIRNWFGAGAKVQAKRKDEVKKEEEDDSATPTIDGENGAEEKTKEYTRDESVKLEPVEDSIKSEEPLDVTPEHRLSEPKREETEISLAVDDNLDVPNNGKKRKATPDRDFEKSHLEESEPVPKKQQKLEDSFQYSTSGSVSAKKTPPSKSPKKTSAGKVTQGPVGVPKITSFFKK
ncbi:DUF159-domain-containing protein [Ascobolus immersus RN42]|uniref:DUF159-domain-containing protein n=1 Tax=Ascobolus immersus RN42 TaxID=1160509 RepID=A0A3N4HM99_ASCIM|nr:DUF159-domain-containing protein [Ascobolus immersus RN42]